jgi:hypothetical protein
MQNHVISHVLDGRKFSVDFYQERERTEKQPAIGHSEVVWKVQEQTSLSTRYN